MSERDMFDSAEDSEQDLSVSDMIALIEAVNASERAEDDPTASEEERERLHQQLLDVAAHRGRDGEEAERVEQMKQEQG